MKRIAALAALATLALGACGDGRYARLLTEPFKPEPPRAVPVADRAAGDGTAVPRPMPRYIPGHGPERVAPLAVHGVRPLHGDSHPGLAPAEASPAETGLENGHANGVAAGAVRPIPEVQPPQAQELIGLAPAALRDMIGVPALRRVEGPAQVWQYRHGACVFDVFFEAGPAAPQVTHVEARTQAGRAADPDRCYAGLIARGLKAAPARAATGVTGE